MRGPLRNGDCVRPFSAHTEPLLIDQILNAKAPPARSINPTISPELATVIDNGLQKDPNQRHGTMNDLLEALEEVRNPHGAQPDSSRRQPRMRERPWLGRRGPVAASFIALAAVVVGWIGYRGFLEEPALSFAPRDWVLITDFDNQTGEPIFDGSLRTAFSVALGQSTHVNVVPAARVAEALQRMGRPDVPRIDAAVGREIAIREHVRGLVAPAIARVGERYVVSARLIDPHTSADVRSYVEQAANADEILDAVGRMGESVRRDLGESLPSIQQNSRSLPSVTTASLEALQSYADGVALWRRGRSGEAVVHHERAIERDPKFAMAHAALGTAFLSFHFNQPARGKEHLERAGPGRAYTIRCGPATHEGKPCACARKIQQHRIVDCRVRKLSGDRCVGVGAPAQLARSALPTRHSPSHARRT
jgi:hypothetical protein